MSFSVLPLPAWCGLSLSPLFIPEASIECLLHSGIFFAMLFSPSALLP